jgi:acylphosphatase
MEYSRIEVIIKGRVQGVGFRFFTEDIANSLGIKGYVRNLYNGNSVEVVAEGEKTKLEKFIKQLKIGPPSAKVENVDIKWSTYKNEFNKFSIRY